MNKRHIVLVATAAAVVLLGGGGFFAATTYLIGHQTAQRPASPPEVTAPSAPTATPSQPATPAPGPSQASMPGAPYHPVPQPTDMGQPTGQGMTMSVSGARISPMGGTDTSGLLEVDVTMHNANIGAGRPDYTLFVVSDPAGNRSTNVDTLPMVPAHSSLDAQLAFQVELPGASQYTVRYWPTGSQWMLEANDV